MLRADTWAEGTSVGRTLEARMLRAAAVGLRRTGDRHNPALRGGPAENNKPHKYQNLKRNYMDYIRGSQTFLYCDFPKI